MNNLESKMQCACVRWFRLAHHKIASLLFAVPNGGARSAITGAILKAEGVTKGVADLLLLVPNSTYHGLCIEMKTKQGHQSPSQKAWQSAVEAQGYKYVVIRSLDQFMAEVTRYLADMIGSSEKPNNCKKFDIPGYENVIIHEGNTKGGVSDETSKV